MRAIVQGEGMLGSEVSILALYGLLVVLTIVIQSAATVSQFGVSYAASARDEGRAASGVAARLVRTMENSVVALALFAPAVLAVKAQGATSENTLVACQVFVGARLLYAIAYPAGIPYVRTAVWAVGFGATAFLYVQAV